MAGLAGEFLSIHNDYLLKQIMSEMPLFCCMLLADLYVPCKCVVYYVRSTRLISSRARQLDDVEISRVVWDVVEKRVSCDCTREKR